MDEKYIVGFKFEVLTTGIHIFRRFFPFNSRTTGIVVKIRVYKIFNDGTLDRIKPDENMMEGDTLTITGK